MRQSWSAIFSLFVQQQKTYEDIRKTVSIPPHYVAHDCAELEYNDPGVGSGSLGGSDS